MVLPACLTWFSCHARDDKKITFEIKLDSVTSISREQHREIAPVDCHPSSLSYQEARESPRSPEKETIALDFGLDGNSGSETTKFGHNSKKVIMSVRHQYFSKTSYLYFSKTWYVHIENSYFVYDPINDIEESPPANPTFTATLNPSTKLGFHLDRFASYSMQILVRQFHQWRQEITPGRALDLRGGIEESTRWSPEKIDGSRLPPRIFGSTSEEESGNHPRSIAIDLRSPWRRRGFTPTRSQKLGFHPCSPEKKTIALDFNPVRQDIKETDSNPIFTAMIFHPHTKLGFHPNSIPTIRVSHRSSHGEEEQDRVRNRTRICHLDADPRSIDPIIIGRRGITTSRSLSTFGLR
ncbi:hypothetical protein Droror1_Dr00008046 [Drosera rotundifolia]